MDKIEILYDGRQINGNKVYANIEDNGEIYIDIPNKNGIERIVRQDNTWKYGFQSNTIEDYYCIVILHDDGRIEWTNDMNTKIVDGGTFNPNNNNNNFPQNVAQEMYDIASQIEEYQKLGMSETDIIELKESLLETTLNLLGTTSNEKAVEPTDIAGYGILGKIGDRLQHYRNYSAELKKRRKKQSETYPAVKKFPQEDDELKESLEKAGQEIIQNVRFMKSQDLYVAEGRKIDSTFYRNMSEKISKEEWEIYSKAVKATIELLIELNYDVVKYRCKKDLKDCSELSGKELEDRISKLIDSHQFDQACNIEDKFIISECERVTSKPEVAENFNLEALKREAMATREEKTRYARRYEKIQEYCYDENRIKKEKKGISIDD